MLPSIPRLEFHPEIHRYRYKYEWLLNNVTGVLSFDMDPAKRAAIEHYKSGEKGWAARGTALHKVMEQLLKGIDFEHADIWDDWVGDLVNCDLFQTSEALAVEYPLCDEKKDLGGSFDFLLKDEEGKLVLGDLKSCSSKSAAKRREPATAQLGAYLDMLLVHHPTLEIDKCVTVVSGPGICKTIEDDPDECLNEWYEKWGLFEADRDLRENWDHEELPF